MQARRRLLVVLLVLVIAVAARAYAEDVGAVIAALTDAEAECRYMRTLCSDALARRAPYEAAYKKAYASGERSRSLFEAWKKDLMSDKKEMASKRAIETAQADRNEYDVAHLRWLGPHNDVVSALKVLAAKRGVVPDCVPSECVTEAGRSD
jgi:hypothetical protein